MKKLIPIAALFIFLYQLTSGQTALQFNAATQTYVQASNAMNTVLSEQIPSLSKPGVM